MKKVLNICLLLMMLGLIVTNTTYALTGVSWKKNDLNKETNINSESRIGICFGTVISHLGAGVEIEYIPRNNFSFYVNRSAKYDNNDSRQVIEGINRLGVRYYKDKNNGFFGDLSFGLKDNVDNSESLEVKEIGFGVGAGYIHQLSEFYFINLESGYKMIGDNSEFHLRGGVSFSWSNFIERSRRREQEEKAREETEKLRRLQSFLNRHPNITEEAKEYLRNNRDELEDDRINYIDDNSNLNGEGKSKIILKEIWIGMKDEKLEVIKGKPRDINRTTTAYGVREQWVYGSVGNRRYYYFENEILTTIQD